MKIFNDMEYGFTDSIIDYVKTDKNKLNDFIIGISYFQGTVLDYDDLVLRLKNVKELELRMDFPGDRRDMFSPYMLKDIIKTKKGDYTELIIQSNLNFYPQFKEPLISCICEEVYIECLRECKKD